MAYQSNAANQPKIYRINLTISDDTLDEAIVAQVESVASAAGDPADHSKLKSAGLFDKYLHNMVVQALKEHLVWGS